MMSDTVTSECGVRFTESTLDVMREFQQSLASQGGTTMSYAAGIVDGELSIALGGDYEPPANAIKDVVGDVTFYWYVEPEILGRLRELVVDTSYGLGTRLLTM